MSYTIKNNISFDEYCSIIDRVISDCFEDEVYSPAAYEISLRNALISVFVPEYDLSDCKDTNALWDKLTNKECEDFLCNIRGTTIYNDIVSAIEQGISHRLRAIESSPMSLSDIALSKLIGVVAEKINSIDNTDVLNKDTISALINAEKQINKEGFEKKLVDEMIDHGLISKPNGVTRRKTTKENKNISVTTNVIPVDNEPKTDNDK